MKVVCNDGCQQEFQIDELKTEGVDQLPDNVERNYLECPNCQQKYTSYYSNDEIKRLQDEIKHLQQKHPLKVKQKNRLLKLRKKVQWMANTLKAEIEAGTSE